MEEREGRQGSEEAFADLERLASVVVNAGLEVHRALGPGLLEAIYEQCLARELALRGVSVKRQVSAPVIYKGVALEGA